MAFAEGLTPVIHCTVQLLRETGWMDKGRDLMQVYDLHLLVTLPSGGISAVPDRGMEFNELPKPAGVC